MVNEHYEFLFLEEGLSLSFTKSDTQNTPLAPLILIYLFLQEAYNAAERSEKSKISKMIVSYIRNQTPPGRFLEKDPETHQWNDMDDKRAIEKTSQAIRECIRKETAKASKDNSNDPNQNWLADGATHQWALAVEKMDLSSGIAASVNAVLNQQSQQQQQQVNTVNQEQLQHQVNQQQLQQQLQQAQQQAQQQQSLPPRSSLGIGVVGGLDPHQAAMLAISASTSLTQSQSSGGGLSHQQQNALQQQHQYNSDSRLPNVNNYTHSNSLQSNSSSNTNNTGGAGINATFSPGGLGQSQSQNQFLGRFQNLNMNEQNQQFAMSNITSNAAGAAEQMLNSFNNSFADNPLNDGFMGNTSTNNNPNTNPFEDFIRSIKMDQTIYGNNNLPQSHDGTGGQGGGMVGGGGVDASRHQQNAFQQQILEPDPIPFIVAQQQQGGGMMTNMRETHFQETNQQPLLVQSSDNGQNNSLQSKFHQSQSAPALSLEAAHGLSRSKKSLKSFHRKEAATAPINEEWPDDQKNATFNFPNTGNNNQPNRFASNFGSLLEGTAEEGGTTGLNSGGGGMGGYKTGAGAHPGVNLPDFGLTSLGGGDIFSPGMGSGNNNGNLNDSYDLRRKQRSVSSAGSNGGGTDDGCHH
jgi:hypothetical protein